MERAQWLRRWQVLGLLGAMAATGAGCGGGDSATELEGDESQLYVMDRTGDLWCPWWRSRCRSAGADAGTRAGLDAGRPGLDAGTASRPDAALAGADAAAPAPTPGEVVPPSPAAKFLPTPTGVCPQFADGELTFSPAGIAARKVRVWMGAAAATLDGPLIFYWHGTGSSPSEAVYGLGQSTIDAVTAAGGIVAAPTADPAAGFFPWFLTAGSRTDDLVLADEILACARQQVGIDVRRIHSLGMSAGGLQTTQMSFRRSGYLASVVTYSGGLSYGVPTTQDPTNLFAALIFDGGPNDVVIMNFQKASESYWSALHSRGQFAAICNHGDGHSIPTDARDSVWAFFLAHPYGVRPSPYANGLPAGFVPYCSLAP